ncbi:MAG: hypothetical protein AAGE84_07350 [Cyanobacteria bacterium P01_G01_bin.39]
MSSDRPSRRYSSKEVEILSLHPTYEKYKKHYILIFVISIIILSFSFIGKIVDFFIYVLFTWIYIYSIKSIKNNSIIRLTNHKISYREKFFIFSPKRYDINLEQISYVSIKSNLIQNTINFCKGKKTEEEIGNIKIFSTIGELTILSLQNPEGIRMCIEKASKIRKDEIGYRDMGR